MPDITLLGARSYQWGKETTRGTAVPATSKIAVDVLDFEPLDAVDRPSLAKGILLRNVGSETVITRGSRIIVPETPMIYDQIQNFLSSLKGGVSGSGAGADKTWTYTPSLSADPLPESWTIERRLSDGVTNLDNEWAYCLWEQFRFSYQADRPLMFSAQGFGRRVQSSTHTAGQALPTIEEAPDPLVTAYIDANWAGLGGTQVAGQVLKADITINTGLKPKITLDGRSDLDFTTYIFDGKMRSIDMEMTVMVKATSGQYATEKTAAEAQSLRAVRFKVLGSAVGGTNREFTLDMLLKHEAGSVFKVDSEDGQDIVSFKFQESTDLTNWLTAKVVNAVAAYA